MLNFAKQIDLWPCKMPHMYNILVGVLKRFYIESALSERRCFLGVRKHTRNMQPRTKGTDASREYAFNVKWHLLVV